MLGVGEHSSPPSTSHISLRMSDFRAAMVGCCQMFTSILCVQNREAECSAVSDHHSFESGCES